MERQKQIVGGLAEGVKAGGGAEEGNRSERKREMKEARDSRAGRASWALHYRYIYARTSLFNRYG